MTAVTTTYALDVLSDLIANGEIFHEPFEYDDTKDVYTLSKEWDTGVTEVIGTLNGTEEHVIVKGTDYQEVTPDQIDWSIGGDNPDDGTQFFVTYDRPKLYVNTIAVGDGTGPVSETDTDMSSELYSTNPNAKYAIDGVERGERVYTIVITGGVEVPADSQISEFGLFDDTGSMLYHETRDAITISQGVTQEFRVRFDINN